MLSGPQALKALDQALKDIRREEDELTQRIARSSERVARLRETELALMRDLAGVRLAPDAQEALTGRLSAAESRARDMLKRHADAVAAHVASLAEGEETLTRLAQEREEALAALEAEQKTLDGLAERIEAERAADPEDRARREAAAELAAMAAQAERKAEQAEADREEKGRPYREDPLFLYLYENGYGTPRYAGRALARWLDGRVARLIGFQAARPNFVMLNEIPERLREHAIRLAQDAAEAEAEIEAHEIAAIDKAGGGPAREAIAQLTARIAAIDEAIVAQEDARDALTEEHKELAEGGDPVFGEAVDVLARAMAGTDIAELMEAARQTPTPEDDAVVAKIEDIRLRLSEEELEGGEQHARLKTLETRRRELEDIEYEFKRQRFDDPRSRFGEDRLVGDALDEFLKGAITATAYWGMWRQSQGWRGGSAPTPRRSPGGGGFTLPPGGFSPRPPSGGSWGGGSKGGGFSRPRTGSRGSRKSGGFRTGGGF